MSIFGKKEKKPEKESVPPVSGESMDSMEQADGAPDVVHEAAADADGIGVDEIAVDEIAVDELVGDEPPSAAPDGHDPIADVEVIADGDGGQDEAESVEVAGHDDGTKEAAPAESSDRPPDGPKADAGKMDKVRELATFRVDSELVRRAWRVTSLGRIALMCVGLFVIVVASAYFFVLQPVNREMHETRIKKNLLHDYVVIQQAGATIGTFKDGLMTGDQRLTVMSEVRLMAEGAGVKIMGDPELLLSRPLNGHFTDYPVRLRLRGTFHEIGEFLSLLESSPRFIVVESVEMTSDVASSSRDSDATVLLALAAWEG